MPALSSQLLSNYKNIVHGFGTKDFGIDYDRIARKLHVLRSQIYYLPNQIHSNKVQYVDQETELDDLHEGDALVTDQPNVIVGVRTADCVPILCHDPVKNVVAAIHAGYKGVLESVVQKTFEMMQRLFACRAQDIVVGIGPAICLEHYEVGFDVIEAFRKLYGDRFICEEYEDARPHLDVRATIAFILSDLGVDEKNVDGVGLCTFEREDLFCSYRRDGGEGRQFNYIGML
jgi:YfiH family protein